MEENRGWSRGHLDPEVFPPRLERQRAAARNEVEEERGWFRVLPMNLRRDVSF